jgi:Rho-binding antiterminator
MNDTPENPYRRINCEFHDVLEALATRRRRSVLVYLAEDGSTQTCEAVITDVYAKAGADYLRLDNGRVLRLDHLLQVDGERPEQFELRFPNL